MRQWYQQLANQIKIFSVLRKPYTIFNPIQDGPFPPPQNLPHMSYIDQTWHSYNLPK